MNSYDTTKFQDDLKSFSLQLTEQQIDQFIRYYKILNEWNNYINLTSITEYDEVMKKHFIDSLSLVKVCDINHFSSVIDVGTGAGFPGLALKIAFPHLEITLLDSLNKRIQFLNAVIQDLGLSGVYTLHGRAEDYARPGQRREQYDLCVSRAVANLSSLTEYCLPFVRVGGYFVSYKSEKWSEEIAISKKAISLLGGTIDQINEFTLPDSDIYRSLVCIRKINSTPKKYPRKAGTPTKEPIK